MLGFWICFWYWICQGSGYTMVLCQGSEYAWICLNNSWICPITPEFGWICLNSFFSIVTGIIWFCFLFSTEYFYSKISNLLLPLGAEGARGRKFWYTQPMIYPIYIHIYIYIYIHIYIHILHYICIYIYAFLMIYLSILLSLFIVFHFLLLQRT